MQLSTTSLKKLALPLALGVSLGVAAMGAKPVQAANAANGAKIYGTNCAMCHGPKGAGDGPASASLNPKPRKFSDPKIMSKIADKTIATTIQKGGAAMKKSPAMPPFPQLKPNEVADLVAHIRALCKCKGPK